MQSAEVRFWKKVDKSGECWNWTGAKSGGYGRFFLEGKFYNAHRIALNWSGIIIPANKEVCHSCDNPSCVRPDHLYLASHAKNMQDAITRGLWKPPVIKGQAHYMWDKRPTHCKRGHEFTSENTYQQGRKRNCKACWKFYRDKYKAGRELVRLARGS